MPIVHRLAVGRGRFGPRRNVELDPPRRRIGDEAVANLAPQLRQLGLLRALVGNEQHVRAVERVDGLDGQVFGIAGADADDEDCTHGAVVPECAGTVQIEAKRIAWLQHDVCGH